MLSSARRIERGVDLTTKIARNAACPCGSGKKYKNCHLGRSLDEPPVEVVQTRTRRAAVVLGAVSLLIGAMVASQSSIGAGLSAAAACGLISAGVLVFSNPPPPKDDSGNPAGLDFGRRD